jgi:carboxymethylenebutenolidase
MRRSVLAAMLALIAFAKLAHADSVKTQTVTFASGAETISGYLATPASAGTHPGILVLHSDGGLTDWVKAQARKLAEHGYVALALDMYRGRVAFDPEIAYNLTISVPPARAYRDMEAGIHYLIGRSDVNKDKIGAVGWAVGGKWSLMLAVNDPFLAACVSHYGAPPANPADFAKIRAPILGIYGAEDLVVVRDDVEKFADAMASAQKPLELKIFRGTGHDFEEPSNRLGYHEMHSQEAWELTLAFLDKHLK